MPTPTVLQLQLGKELKRLREERELTLAEAVEVLGNKETKLSRLERGQSSVRTLDIQVLLDRYGATDEEKAWALETAKHCNQRGRWSGYRSVYAKHFRMAVDLEQDASTIRCYQAELVPGLLQTEDYMRAMFTEGGPRVFDQSIDNAIRARLERQKIVDRSSAPEIGFVMSESCARRQVGDAKVMREQLLLLAEVATLANVQLQILPFKARTYPPACTYPFTTFRIPSPGKAGPLEFVYLEDFHDGRYLDEQDDVETYSHLWARLTGAALDPVASREYLLREADNYL
ncbi:helix-turn-helix domain-containing protein [Saccharopolyspora hattusasensis]|uniref:helix-turn-helix domain-containing protein n=1 Tax=Saccharopolyspora hattusasensis TaxID=1128679 RepID=UPI003D96E794